MSLHSEVLAHIVKQDSKQALLYYINELRNGNAELVTVLTAVLQGLITDEKAPAQNRLNALSYLKECTIASKCENFIQNIDEILIFLTDLVRQKFGVANQLSQENQTTLYQKAGQMYQLSLQCLKAWAILYPSDSYLFASCYHQLMDENIVFPEIDSFSFFSLAQKILIKEAEKKLKQTTGQPKLAQDLLQEARRLKQQQVQAFINSSEGEQFQVLRAIVDAMRILVQKGQVLQNNENSINAQLMAETMHEIQLFQHLMQIEQQFWGQQNGGLNNLASLKRQWKEILEDDKTLINFSEYYQNESQQVATNQPSVQNNNANSDLQQGQQQLQQIEERKEPSPIQTATNNNQSNIALQSRLQTAQNVQHIEQNCQAEAPQVSEDQKPKQTTGYFIEEFFEAPIQQQQQQPPPPPPPPIEDLEKQFNGSQEEEGAAKKHTPLKIKNTINYFESTKNELRDIATVKKQQKYINVEIYAQQFTQIEQELNSIRYQITNLVRQNQELVARERSRSPQTHQLQQQPKHHNIFSASTAISENLAVLREFDTSGVAKILPFTPIKKLQNPVNQIPQRTNLHSYSPKSIVQNVKSASKLKKSLFKNSSVLFMNDDLEIAQSIQILREGPLILSLLFTNQSEYQICGVSLQVHDGVVLDKVPETLPREEQIKIDFRFESSIVGRVWLPHLSIEYELASLSKRLRLDLPISINKFFEVVTYDTSLQNILWDGADSETLFIQWNANSNNNNFSFAKQLAESLDYVFVRCEGSDDYCAIFAYQQRQLLLRAQVFYSRTTQKVTVTASVATAEAFQKYGWALAQLLDTIYLALQFD